MQPIALAFLAALETPRPSTPKPRKEPAPIPSAPTGRPLNRKVSFAVQTPGIDRMPASQANSAPTSESSSKRSSMSLSFSSELGLSGSESSGRPKPTERWDSQRQKLRTPDKAHASAIGPPKSESADWSAQAAGHLWNRLDNPATIRQRAIELYEVFAALDAGDGAAVTARLTEVAARHPRLDLYFLHASATPNARYTDMQKKATRYHHVHRTALSQQLLALVTDMGTRERAAARVQKAQASMSATELDQSHPANVRQLCMALAEADLLALKPALARLGPLIPSVQDTAELDDELALQPYYSLRMMHAKCTVLANQLDKEGVRKLCAAIASALQRQATVSLDLRRMLLSTSFDLAKPENFATLCRSAKMEYAKQQTSLPVDHVSAGATWQDVRTMKIRAAQAYRMAIRATPADRPTQVALQWLAYQIRNTLKEAPTAEGHRAVGELSHLPALPSASAAPFTRVLTHPRPQPKSTPAGPAIRTASEWSMVRDLEDAQEILKRASHLANLLYQLQEGNADKLIALLATIPENVAHYQDHFPPAPMHGGYGPLHALAKVFAIQHPSVSADRLLIFMGDCHQREAAQEQVARDHEAIVDELLHARHRPDVRELCTALRDTHELELEAACDDLVTRITGVLTLDGIDVVQALAIQPYANLRMLRLKCTVLAEFNEAQRGVVLAFRDRVDAARAVQREASLRLREALLKDTLHEEKIAALALVEYAKQTTTIAIDHVSAGATWNEVQALHKALRIVYAYYAEDRAGEFPVEQAAFEWLSVQLRRTIARTD